MNTRPAFIIAAAPRSGTTSLYHYLSQHPEVEMGARKEPAYFHFLGAVPDFDRMAGRHGRALRSESIANYRQARKQAITDHRAYTELWRSEGALAGEATPTYLFDPDAVKVIAQYNPAVKLILLLRDPVERAYSEYLQRMRKGFESAPFEEAITLEPAEIDDFWWGARRYLRTGLYAAPVVRALETFGRSSVHIVSYEDLIENPTATLRDLCGFLGVNPDFQFSTEVAYKGAFVPQPSLAVRMARNERWRAVARRLLPAGRRDVLWDAIMRRRTLAPPPLTKEAESRLYSFFAPDIRALEQILGRKLESWGRTTPQIRGTTERSSS